MTEVKGITVEVGMSTDRVQQKLRAISKHAGALADELDRIDSMNDEEVPTRLEGSE